MKLKLTLATAAFALMSGAVQAEPLKIAVIEPLTGAMQRSGASYADGVRYAVKKINESGGFNGEPVVLKEYDSLGKVELAQERLKQAIDDGNHVIWSMSGSAISATLTDEVKKHNTRNPGKEVIFFSNVYAIDMVEDKCHFFGFKWGADAWSLFKPAARAMHEAGGLGSKTYLLNPNYSYGHQSEEAQREISAELGAEVVGADLVDLLKTQDFSPYVAKIKASGANSVMTATFDSDLILFVKALRQAGLSLPIVGQALDFPGSIGAMGDAAVGAYQPRFWMRGVGGAAGDAFAEDYTKEIGRPPVDFAPEAVFPTLLLQEAGKSMKLDGGPINTTELVLALEQASLAVPGGEQKVRMEDHQGLRPMSVGVATTDTPHKLDGTEIGFNPIMTLTAEEVVRPVSSACVMKRPS